jgi:hypothetical protein
VNHTDLQSQIAGDYYDYPLFSNLLTILDPLSGKILSKSCIHYNMIKVEWRRIRKEVLTLRQLIR